MFYSGEVLGMLREVLLKKTKVFNQLDMFVKETNEKVAIMEKNSLELRQQIKEFKIDEQ